MEKCLLDMPYEILFEIFRNLPKGNLFEISELGSKFADVTGDKRLWKDVYIKYGSVGKTFAFEELYSGPFPVKVIDLSYTEIQPPVSFEIGPRVEVKLLNLSRIIGAGKLTMEAILAKYTFTELHLDHNFRSYHGHIMEIAPEAFSNQTSLEVLSLRGIKHKFYRTNTKNEVTLDFLQWLAAVLSKYCKNLKTLDLSDNDLSDRNNMLALVKNLPTSLEKLCLVNCRLYRPENSFFELFAQNLPNLKELELCPAKVKSPSLLEFKCLEALHVYPYASDDIGELYLYLIRFPALKTVYIDFDRNTHRAVRKQTETDLEALRATLKPHGITTVKITQPPMDDNDVWRIEKTE